MPIPPPWRTRGEAEEADCHIRTTSRSFWSAAEAATVEKLQKHEGNFCLGRAWDWPLTKGEKKDFIIRGLTLTAGKWSLFNLEVGGSINTVCSQQISPRSRVLPGPAGSFAESLRIKEVCAGMGGFSLGFTFCGFTTVALVDISPLACRTLKANATATIIVGTSVTTALLVICTQLRFNTQL